MATTPRTRVVRAAELLSLLALLGCSSSSDDDCDPDAAAARFAGSGFTDCGRVPIGGDPSVVDQCVADAVNAKKAFRAHYDLQGVDSKTASVIAGSSSGAVEFFSWDGDPSGGGGAHPTLDVTDCIGPSVLVSAGRKTVTCTSVSGPTRVCK